MHDRARNFCTYLSSIFDKYVDPEPQVEGQLPSKTRVTSNAIKSYFDKAEDFKNFQFGYLGLLCNNEATRPRIQRLRDIDSDHEYRKESIKNFRELVTQAKGVLERLERVPDEELDTIAIKVSLYINLFTKMYYE